MLILLNFNILHAMEYIDVLLDMSSDSSSGSSSEDRQAIKRALLRRRKKAIKARYALADKLPAEFRDLYSSNTDKVFISNDGTCFRIVEDLTDIIKDTHLAD